jgi:hypothetical protein
MVHSREKQEKKNVLPHSWLLTGLSRTFIHCIPFVVLAPGSLTPVCHA